MQVCGVKGPTVLALHGCFDLVGGVAIDDLHGVHLGVTLLLLHLWLDRTNRGKPFLIGDKIGECDARLLSIKVTDEMSRVPKSLTDFGRWKGAELRNWLLFYSLPVLRGVLAAEYLGHLALLTSAIFIFTSEGITQEKYSTAKCLLLQFYQEFSGLYAFARMCAIMGTSLGLLMFSF
jgi:hypothetical protein